MDQAGTLRELGRNGELSEPGGGEKLTRVFTVTSGKGGVGKTNVVTNLAIALSRAGRKVMILDADLGLANIDIILGLSCQYNLSHVLSGEMALRDVLVEGPEGVLVLPASSGLEEMAALQDEQKATLFAHLEEADLRLDFLLIDTGAGVNSNVTYFNQSAQESIVVVTPEPTSITDAYALIKILSQNYSLKHFHLLINLVKGEKEGLAVYKNLLTVADSFLDVSLNYLGCIETDPEVGKAVRRQQAVLLSAPQSRFARRIGELAEKLPRLAVNTEHAGNPGFFWRQLFSGPAR